MKNILVAAIIVVTTASTRMAETCERLTSLKLPDTTITLAEVVGAGLFKLPATGGATNSAPNRLFAALPAFCRVAATLRPSADSNIQIEVWMPVSGWNGKFEAVGNGGWAGLIRYSTLNASLATELRRGYATASTDTGHVAAGDFESSFAAGHPEKVVDFAYRAVHEMTVQAKAIVRAFYGEPARLSYWNGCSTGGRQGLKEAQKYPADFDGIIAGAPANYWTHMMTAALAGELGLLQNPARRLPREKLAVLYRAVVNACDALDGIKDGMLDDPRRCHFDPKTLVCAEGADATACLTAAQAEGASGIYAATMNPRTRDEIFPGLERGSEARWTVGGGVPDYFKNVVFPNPEWDPKAFDFDKDVALSDAADGDRINATDPNLAAFFQHGGKLLMYHGWSDPLIPPVNSVNYYTSVTNALGGAAKVTDSFRLFMAPGMDHCVGGEGPNRFDALGALERWVEQKEAPANLEATHLTNGVVDRTRPLCPYPQVAQYKGSGSTDQAANFVCAAR